MKNKSVQSKEDSQSNLQSDVAGFSILLIEDDNTLAELWHSYLETQGHQVDCCDTVADATVLLHSNHYDLLIVDIFLRQDGQILAEGGVTIINRVRLNSGFNSNSTEHLAILAVTGADTRSQGKFSALNSVTNLIDASLQKPIKLETLGREVHRLCTANE